MISNISITTALCLSKEDTIALISGRSIAALSRVFINSVPYFAICATGDSPKVEAWAELISSRIYTDADKAEALSWNTIWSREYLHDRIQDKNRIFLNILRIHHLESPIILEGNISGEKVGSFIKLPQSVTSQSSNPILNEATFLHRKQQLENLTPPEHPELEELQSTIDRYAKDHPEAQDFSNDLQEFLGWAEPKSAINHFPDWIPEITTSGNSSDGDLFEKRVRQAFLKLGFTNLRNNPNASLNPESTGGSGGIDFYCEFPYSIVGECKASISLQPNDNKNGAPAQLIKLGHKNLTKEEYDCAIKMIVAPGELNTHAKKTAIGNQMNVISPETLQRLVELKTSHPGSINLLKLKPCLEVAPFGTDADTKVNEFIDKIHQRLNIRSVIIRLVRDCQEKKRSNDVDVDAIHTAYAFSDHEISLDSKEISDILIELSSPLTGYLGRNQETNRFYFLRDLTV